MKVSLQNRKGEYAANLDINTDEVPDVITWNNKTYFCSERTMTRLTQHIHYKEAIVHAIIMTGKKPEMRGGQDKFVAKSLNEEDNGD